MVQLLAAGAVVLFWPLAVAAQPFESVGSRAVGMGGAFVAVSDDASAAYWNPAGFASGAFLSLVLDRTTATVNPRDRGGAGSHSGYLIALGAPPIGLSYYRVRHTTVSATRATEPEVPVQGGDEVRLDSLVTHHTGATLVQSVGPGIAVGATLKLVRGTASSAVRLHSETLLSEAEALAGRRSTTFDADLGVMASLSRFKAGVTVRNLTQPAFEAADEGFTVRLERQVRAGVAILPLPGWIVAVDADLVQTAGPRGPVRHLAAGAEGRLGRKAFVRGGLRVNTVGDRIPAVSVGASYAALRSLLIDAHLISGSERSSRGWGIAARLGY
jgi:hypothetical protein